MRSVAAGSSRNGQAALAAGDPKQHGTIVAAHRFGAPATTLHKARNGLNSDRGQANMSEMWQDGRSASTDAKGGLCPDCGESPARAVAESLFAGRKTRGK